MNFALKLRRMWWGEEASPPPQCRSIIIFKWTHKKREGEERQECKLLFSFVSSFFLPAKHCLGGGGKEVNFDRSFIYQPIDSLIPSTVLKKGCGAWCTKKEAPPLSTLGYNSTKSVLPVQSKRGRNVVGLLWEGRHVGSLDWLFGITILSHWLWDPWLVGSKNSEAEKKKPLQTSPHQTSCACGIIT